MQTNNPLQEIFQIWWVSGIILPIVVTILVGGCVSIWAGVVCARLQEFRQIRLNVTSALLELDMTILTSNQDIMRAILKQQQRGFYVASALTEMGQHRACRQMNSHLRWLLNEMMNIVKITNSVERANALDPFGKQITKRYEEIPKIRPNYMVIALYPMWRERKKAEQKKTVKE
jgi:hypothetical protein